MNSHSREHNDQAEMITPEKIVLNARSKYPRDIIYTNERGETKIYRLVKTKNDCLTLNK